MNHSENELDSVKGALDELFILAGRYRSSSQFSELIKFLSTFKNYSIFNAALVHIQMQGAKYVLPAKQWDQKYGRHPIPNAQPLVMLRPGGPVMFCFDVSQTQGRPLPPGIENPFQVQGNLPYSAYQLIIFNSKQDGIAPIILLVLASLWIKIRQCFWRAEKYHYSQKLP